MNNCVIVIIFLVFNFSHDIFLFVCYRYVPVYLGGFRGLGISGAKELIS